MNLRFPFLTARWTNLILLNYQVDPAMLRSFVPPGCVLDLMDGFAFVSLVAFDFENTRVLGLRWPGFVRFPEINLRFYVRYHDATGEHRGVCFIREFVALRTVAGLARLLYNEPYQAVEMNSQIVHQAQNIEVKHSLNFKGRVNSVSIVGSKAVHCPPPHSTEQFFKEHKWGFGTSRRGRLIRYQVLHPVWNVYPVQSYTLDWDWKSVYGDSWADMQNLKPISVVLAEGSAVKVYPYSLPG